MTRRALSPIAALAVAWLAGAPAPAAAAGPLVPQSLPEARPGLALSVEADPSGMPPALAAAGGTASVDSGRDTSPLLAGFLSAVLPGSGQLLQGQRRGWIYLGVETVAWFAVFALDNAGDQAESDAHRFADGHWDWDRYRTVTDCGEGLGPTQNFEEEAALLERLYDNNRDAFYDDIGDLRIYACGWDGQPSRAEYNRMRDDANDLYRAARGFLTVAFLNHVVSAVDAAKSAANRRKEREHALDLRFSPQGGTPVPAVRVSLSRSF